MMKLKKTLPLLVLLMMITQQPLKAQVAIGEWRTHLPYYFCNLVMLTDEYAYCSSTSGLFRYGLTDNSLSPVTRTDGLSDNVVSTMASRADGLSVFCYDNSNVDILQGGEITNIPDIFKEQIPGDKSIYDVYFKEDLAYLSCGFGIVVLDLGRYEIRETYYIGDNGDALKVNQVTSDGNWLYAATARGIRRAQVDDPFIVDFNSWETIPDIPNSGSEFSSVVFFGGQLFAMARNVEGGFDKLYAKTGAWSEFMPIPMDTYEEVRISAGRLVITGNAGVGVLNNELEVLEVYTEGTARSAAIDQGGELWVADYGRGLIRVSGGNSEIIRPNGPYTAQAVDMQSAGNKLYSVPGGVSSTFGNLFRAAILQFYTDKRWKSTINYDFRDLVQLAIDPSDDSHVYAASWGYGLVEYRDGQVVGVYNEENSSLQNFNTEGNVIRIGGLAFDDGENLWMTNTAVARPVSVLKRDGTWKSFDMDGLLTDYSALGELVFTGSGHLWGIIPRGNGLFAADFNGTLDNEEDDTYRVVSVVDENGGLITNDIYAIAEDLNGNLWLGTNQGILVIYTPSRLFSDGSVFASEIIVPRDDGTDFGDPLLQTQQITCIEVDGANRKWIGTATGGAFLVSANGLEQIHSFNTSNSPILSNGITDICVDGVSGEVFFGTEKGVISFRGSSTAGGEDYSGVKVFPNPVRPDYEGPIAISGLMAETTVKITDVSGNLVYETESFGGQAVWDGRNFRGERVATGTYLVFLANEDATDAHVTKILFIH